MYPEKIPNSLTPLNTFKFNLESSRDVKKQLESQIASLDERIEKIVDHFTIQDMPIIRFILNVSEEREELKKVSRALDRIADLIHVKNELLPKLEVIKIAEKDPNWFAWTFGDFDSDIDSELQNFTDGNFDD